VQADVYPQNTEVFLGNQQPLRRILSQPKNPGKYQDFFCLISKMWREGDG